LLDSADLRYPPGSSTILYQRSGDTYQIVVEREFVKASAAAGEAKPDPNEAPSNGAPSRAPDDESSETNGDEQD
jgi:hypothetical protein